jgi:acyl-CoA dehydrogenase
MVDLCYRAQVQALAERTRAFIRETVLPIEDAHDGDITAAGGDVLRVQLQRAAREAGVFAPHAPAVYGGHGLPLSECVPIFEEAGYSLFGPVAMNIAAPDEGNVHLLAHIADPEQKQQYLQPLARGQVRSGFAMSEPAPGAGSDPTALATRAIRVAGGWRINGRKWFITGAHEASFFIIMVRTSKGWASVAVRPCLWLRPTVPVSESGGTSTRWTGR